MKRSLAGVFVFAAACSSSASGPKLVAGFDPPPVEKGYVRLVAPEVDDVQPGDNLNLCQWLAPPAKDAGQVVDLKAYQGRGGHHFVLYATSEEMPIGESHICTTMDMLSVNFLGATEAGGEGEDDVSLPDGYAFDLPAGMWLMSNTHYLNASDDTYDTQSVVDIKYGDPKNPLAPVGFVAVNFDQFDIPPNQDLTMDAYCQLGQDLSFFMWGDHMHQWGAGEFSEVIHADGTTTQMASDPIWSPELTYNTPWVHWSPSTPFVVKASDVFHLHCSWHNTTDTDILFPTEMCVGSGMVLEGMPQAVCEANPTPPASM
ncbi:MAG TPA: hypothetical protein VMJ10_35065 [Kofleriaceae bacterium]|nr:hypothetical protein [Kofleriaceae bacterium]